MVKKRERRQVSVTIGGERHYFRGKTLGEAAAKRDVFVASFKRTVRGSNMPLSEWIKLWYDIVAPTVTRSTLESYHRIIDKHITPNFGDTSLDEISHIDVREYMNNLLKEKKSVRTANYFLERFKAVLAQAVRDELIPKNPLSVIKKAKETTKKEKAILTIEQFDKLLAAIPDEQLKRCLILDISTGLSRSELLGLRWSDIDYDRATISVEQTIIKIYSKVKISSLTKRPSRKRTIYIDDGTIAILKEQHKYQLRKRSCFPNFIDRSLVFSDKDGSPIKPDTITKEVSRYGERAGMPSGFTLNSLRHTHATLLLQNGVNMKIIQQRLGHSSIVTTLQTYSHVTPLDEKNAANKIMELRKPKTKKSKQKRLP